MPRQSKTERAVKAWQDATGCASPQDAAEKIRRLTEWYEGQAALVLIAIQASNAAHQTYAEIGAILGCAPVLSDILAAVKARKPRRAA